MDLQFLMSVYPVRKAIVKHLSLLDAKNGLDFLDKNERKQVLERDYKAICNKLKEEVPVVIEEKFLKRIDYLMQIRRNGPELFPLGMYRLITENPKRASEFFYFDCIIDKRNSLCQTFRRTKDTTDFTLEEFINEIGVGTMIAYFQAVGFIDLVESL